MAFFHTYLSLELKRLYNEISIEGHNIIGDESIMSIADETVIKVSEDDFIKKPIKSIKNFLENRNKLTWYMINNMKYAGLLFVNNKNLCAYIICEIGNNYSIDL